MTEDKVTTIQAQAAIPKPTEDEVRAEIKAAVDAGDYKLAAKLSGMQVASQKVREVAELKVKQDALGKVQGQLELSIFKFVEEKFIAKGLLDNADGVWITWDFDTQIKSIKLLKSSAAKVKSTGEHTAGAGKRFDASTKELVAELADTLLGNGEAGTIKAPAKMAGMTVQAAYDADAYPEGTNLEGKTFDRKNWEYKLRVALVEFKGLTPKA